MTAITYVAKRRIASDHTVDTEYTLDVGMQEITPRDQPVGEQSVSQGGRMETVLDRVETVWQFTTTELETDTTEADHMREFIASAMDGQTLTIDPYGTSGSPDNPISAVLVHDDSAPNRISLYQIFSFRVREQ